MTDYIKPISKQCTKEISYQMENTFYKLQNNEEKNQIGFFCYIKFGGRDIPVLIANYFMEEEEPNEINISINDINKTIELGDVRFKSREYNITIIEIKEIERNEINFLKFDDILYEKDREKLYYEDLIYIIHYSNKDNVFISYSKIDCINESKIIYKSEIDFKNKLAIIFNLSNNKIIGLHKKSLNNYNKGIFFNLIIKGFLTKYKKKYNKQFKNSIEILIKVEKDDIKKDIYFLDNKIYDVQEKVYICTHDNLKELNEDNTELLINNNNYKYKKFFVPEKEGEYNIKLTFKNYLIDCSYMFTGCENIVKINFTNFETKYVKKMNWMFNGCINLKYINLISFDTKNVVDMSFMFLECKNLLDLNLYFFNTKNVTTMRSMFK